MPPTKIKAIILKKIDFRETSVIVHLLTDSTGKISGLMKGVRCVSKKIPPIAYQEGACIEAFVYLKSRPGLELVTKPAVLEIFNFHSDKLVLWKKILFLVDKLVPASRFNSKEIYEFVFNIGKLIPSIKNHRAVEIYITEKLLFLLGFGPFLEKCLVCGSQDQLNFFSGKLGGVVCSKCQAGESTAFKIPAKHIDVLRFFSKIPADNLSMVKYIPDQLFENLMKCLNEIIHYHINE